MTFLCSEVCTKACFRLPSYLEFCMELYLRDRTPCLHLFDPFFSNTQQFHKLLCLRLKFSKKKTNSGQKSSRRCPLPWKKWGLTLVIQWYLDYQVAMQFIIKSLFQMIVSPWRSPSTPTAISPRKDATRQPLVRPYPPPSMSNCQLSDPSR